MVRASLKAFLSIDSGNRRVSMAKYVTIFIYIIVPVPWEKVWGCSSCYCYIAFDMNI